MGTVYAVVNQKGGVGKTTTAVNVAAAAAALGRKVLLVDLDPQGNATSGVGVPKEGKDRPRTTAYDVLLGQAQPQDAIISTRISGMDLLPSNLDLAAAEVELMPRLARETILRSALATVKEDYSLVLIDAPPSLGILTINAMVAADALIIPIQCEYYALEGVSQLMKMVEMVRRAVNPGLRIPFVVLTMYDPRARLNQEVAEDVRRAFGDCVLQRPVPRNIRIAEAPSHGVPVTLYDPRCRGALAYVEMAKEVLRDAEAGAG
ncbi:MAG: ParA family protein [Chthonomonadales bacterium]